MTKRNTKEIILFKALELFADKGYDGVTVRDIANEVGIMQSSLYKHYTSKQEIFNTLVNMMKDKFKEASDSLHLPQGTVDTKAAQYGKTNIVSLIDISTSIFHYYLTDPYASQFRRMLSIERYKNKDVDALYRELYLDTPLADQTLLFTSMIQQGIMKEADPKIMAMQFFSPIFVLLNRYDGMPEKEEDAIVIIKKHVEQFDHMYKK